MEWFGVRILRWNESSPVTCGMLLMAAVVDLVDDAPLWLLGNEKVYRKLGEKDGILFIDDRLFTASVCYSYSNVSRFFPHLSITVSRNSQRKAHSLCFFAHLLTDVGLNIVF